MNLDAWCYRSGELLALVAIYGAVGGPTFTEGGTIMVAATALMGFTLLYHGVGIIRQIRNRRSEVPA